MRVHIVTAHLIKKKTCLRDKVEKGYSRQKEQYVQKQNKTKTKQQLCHGGRGRSFVLETGDLKRRRLNPCIREYQTGRVWWSLCRGRRDPYPNFWMSRLMIPPTGQEDMERFVTHIMRLSGRCRAASQACLKMA